MKVRDLKRRTICPEQQPLFILLCLLFATTSLEGQVAVIAHKSVPAETLASDILYDFYSGEIRAWEDGKPIVVFDLTPKGKVKDAFYKYIGKSPSRMKSIWMVNMLSGEGDPPESLESEEAMLKKVATTPGAVGFVGESLVTDEVKVLVIIQEKKT